MEAEVAAPFTAEQQAFLEAYPDAGSVSDAVRAVGITRRTPYHWMANNPAFALAFAQAKRESQDMLISVAQRRAREGTSKMSDVLLMFLIKQGDPSYRDNVTITHAGAVLHGTVDLNALDSHDRMALLNLAVSHEQQKQLGTPTPSTDEQG